MGLNDRPAPLPMRGRHWILPLDRLVTQSGGPLEASAGQEDRTPSGQPKRHGDDSDWVPTEPAERFSTATKTRLTSVLGSPGYKGSLFCMLCR
jgi:hypothetical protein